MNKEIEELLNKLKKCRDYDDEVLLIKQYGATLLLSYIEQIEKCYCNRTDCIGRIKDSKKYDSLLQKYEQLQNNRDKAYEFVKEKRKVFEWYDTDLFYLESLLKGDSDE